MTSLKLFVKAFMPSQVIIDNILGKIVTTLSLKNLFARD